MKARAPFGSLDDLASHDRFRWAVRVRWLVISGFLILALCARTLGLFASIRPCVTAAVLGSVLNATNHWCVERWRWVIPITIVALLGDLLLITYVTLSTGGVNSPFITMYVVQVLATAMLVDTTVAGVTAVVAVVLFGAGLVAEAQGVYQNPAITIVGHGPAEQTLAHQVTWSAFLLYSLTLLVFLGGYISQRLRRSELDLAAKNRELEDAITALATANQELLAAYERLKQTEVHLIQSEKMHALGQLVAGVAHELNNPISFVSANMEHLRLYLDRLERLLDMYEAVSLLPTDRAAIDQLKQRLRIAEVLDDLPGLLRDCEEGAQRTKHIVSELRTFSRSDELDQWRRIDVHDCIASTLALLSYHFKDGICVHREYACLPEIECIPGRINQVLMNLLANAVDAIDGAGHIWITTQLGPEPAPGERGSRYVLITVRDDGVGIPVDFQARIFDPFFTTKEVGKGTGLGLSVSYSIVAQHHGSVEFHSTPGEGSCFTLCLPIDRLPTP